VRAIHLIFIVLITASLVYSQNVSVSDYKVAVSEATTFRANGFWNWSQVGDSVYSNTASANLIFRKFYTSLPFAWFFNVDASGGNDDGRKTYDIIVDGNIRKYIWDKEDWFAFSGFSVEGSKDFAQVASNMTVGAGYGRYINATALAKAVRIEEHLIKDNVISGHLQKGIIINIANIIERENEYINLYGAEVYETQWFADIEKEIQASGLLRGSNIGSIGILRMRQVLFGINERVNQRFYGWDVSAGALFTITKPNKSPAGSPNLTINGRYSYPFSWKTQLNLDAGVFTPIDSSFAKEVTVNTGFDFIYELSNRINLLTGYRFGVFKPQGQTALVSNSVNLSFLFYLENNIYFGVNASYDKQTRSQRQMKTSLTLSYNLF
jgi:hypothetical protein